VVALCSAGLRACHSPEEIKKETGTEACPTKICPTKACLSSLRAQRGNPVFLLGYLPDYFLDYFIWIASHYLPWGGLAMTWKTFGKRYSLVERLSPSVKKACGTPFFGAV